MSTARTARLGLVSIALATAAALVDRMWTFPGSSAGSREIAAFAGAHHDVLVLAMVLNTAGVTLWLAFGVGVAVRLRAAAPGEEVLLGLFLVGLVAFVVLLLTGFTAFWLLLARRDGGSGALYDVTFGLLAMSGAPTALCLAAYAAIVRRTGALPAATAGVAVLGAAAHVGLLASLAVPTGFFSLEGGVILAVPGTLFAWIVVTALALLRAPLRSR